MKKRLSTKKLNAILIKAGLGVAVARLLKEERERKNKEKKPKKASV